MHSETDFSQYDLRLRHLQKELKCNYEEEETNYNSLHSHSQHPSDAFTFIYQSSSTPVRLRQYHSTPHLTEERNYKNTATLTDCCTKSVSYYYVIQTAIIFVTVIVWKAANYNDWQNKKNLNYVELMNQCCEMFYRQVP